MVKDTPRENVHRYGSIITQSFCSFSPETQNTVIIRVQFGELNVGLFGSTLTSVF